MAEYDPFSQGDAVPVSSPQAPKTGYDPFSSGDAEPVKAGAAYNPITAGDADAVGPDAIKAKAAKDPYSLSDSEWATLRKAEEYQSPVEKAGATISGAGQTIGHLLSTPFHW